MHTKPMAESDGTLQAGKLLPDKQCPKCKLAGHMVMEEWDSSCGGYTDYKFTCGSCNHAFWVDGSDS